MEQVIRKHGFKIILVLVILIIAGLFMMSQMKDSTNLRFNDPAPAFELTNVDGSTVSLDNTDDQVRLVYFYFSHCPDVCQPTTYFLYQVQKGLIEDGSFGDEASIMSITFDPERDTTERLKEFADSYHADLDGWYFLRSDDPYGVRQLAQEYGVLVQEMEDGNFAHGNFITLVDKKGNIRERYTMTEDLTAEQIVEDMKSLM